MDEKEQIIKNIHETYEAIDDFVKLWRANLFNMLPDISIEELKEIEEDADVDLYYAQEDYESILQATHKPKVSVKADTGLIH